MTKHLSALLPARGPRGAAPAALLVLALVLTACASPGGPEAGGASGPGTATGPAAPDAVPASGSAAALSHIHGLGVRGDALYVATHQGLRTPDASGRPLPVGDRRDDFMGFTVAPDGTFLASGHPAPGAGGPADLGLVSSTDAGLTWRTRSLAGEVDFHALDTASDATVYGYDSANGLLRAGPDGVTWDGRAALRALDIAVSPTAPGTVLATTGSGTVRSTDGGRSFAPVADRVLAYVDWAAPDALFGVAPDGVLFRGSGGGTGWARVSAVPGGAPQALTVVDAHRLFVATRDGVYESRDAGRTFVRRVMVTAGSAGH